MRHEQALGGNSGSREPSPSCTGLGPAGFDPGRIADWLVDSGAAYWGISMCHQRKLYWKHDGGVVPLDAIAMETQGAETGNTGSVAKP